MRIAGMARRWIVAAVVLAAVPAAWLLVNPPGRLGFCRFGLAVYDCRPYVLSDLQVRPDGEVRTVAKTHDIDMAVVDWLVASRPEVLVVAAGWDGRCEAAAVLQRLPGIEVQVLNTSEARRLYNRLRKSGRRVALHYHSTC